MEPEYDDETLLISRFYPVGITSHTQFLPAEQGGVVVDLKPARRRRNRKKNKGGGDGGGGGAVMRGNRKLREEQVKMLEESFRSDRKLEPERKERLAAEVGLDGRQVAVWFQNRRARWKSKMLEEECSKLRAEHQATVTEKRRLEAELSKLKVQLDEAEKEIERIKMEQRSGGLRSNSPSSSLSMETVDPFFLGDFGMEGLDHVFNVLDNTNNYIHGLEWDNNIYYI
ncbi:hypothetical protein ABFS82_12G033900 [Erythranthe guttata]